MRKTHRETPRAFIFPAREIIHLARRVIGHFVIELHLVGNLGNTGPRYRAHIVIPPFDPLARFAIVRRPAKIWRVNISGQAFFETMQLIRPDEMHLS